MLEDYMRVFQENRTSSEEEIYSAEDIAACVRQVTPLQLGQEF
jgi:hypothetical protein